MKMKIQEPIDINGMRIKNRLGLAPMVNMPGGDDGYISEQTIRWFEARAKGGTGLIMTGAVVVTPPTEEILKQRIAAGMTKWVGVTDDKYIPGWTELADVIHGYGAKLGVQTVALGPQSGLGASPPPYPDETHPKKSAQSLGVGEGPVHVVTIEEIEQHTSNTVAVAVRLKTAGVDCFELHLAHGGANLYASWVSPMYNRRTDEYGGSWQNRLRFPVETIRRVRQAVGPDYPILVRIDADELLGKWGIRLEDALHYIVPAMEEAGVDCFDVSQGSIMHSPQGIVIPLYYPRGCFIHNAEAVKSVTSLPVIGVGNIFDIGMAERFLQEDKADMIFMARQLTCDPETPNKYFEKKADEIRECIGCIGGCGRPCAINYDIQDEPVPLTMADKARKVLVIGGGVAGMEAARVASLRGHSVSLIEKDSQLGGMVDAISHNPLLEEFGNLVKYLSNQMRIQGVDVSVCKEAGLPDVVKHNPDVVIVATGSRAVIPELARDKPGVITYRDACREPRKVGQKVIVWGFFGSELAIALAEQGKDVVLIGKGSEASIGSDVSGPRRFWLMRKLTDIDFAREAPETIQVTNPRVLAGTDIVDISLGGVLIRNSDEGESVLPYDTIIVSQRFSERQKNNTIISELQGHGFEVHVIGDCAQVRGIKDAIWTANEVARTI
ncbi:MAG TPA: FAD-dependent oxidoreductase [Dehalococcoidia bacterium]|nr:FAD-dependent oxidoreductase [Dehalococcoidia bacterium]